MCAGKQSRMGAYEGAKQLVPINGTPNLARTIAMLRTYNDMLISVVAPPTSEWIKFCRDNHVVCSDTPDPLFLRALPSLLTNGPRAQRQLVIAGDVVLSPQVLEQLMAGTAEINFAGRFTPSIYTGRPAGELFGVSVYHHAKLDFLTAVDIVLKEAEAAGSVMEKAGGKPEDIAAVMEKNGRLWALMHTLEDTTPCGCTRVHDCGWTDYSDDIDGPDDLEVLPKIEAAIKAKEATTPPLRLAP